VKAKKYTYCIIDVPGHLEFIKNMVTGITKADAAILIIDVKEGSGEQTRRHVYISHMLGLYIAIVLVNKMDLVGYSEEEFRKIKEGLHPFLDNMGIKSSIFIPISAKEGDNLSGGSRNTKWYKGPTVIQALGALRVNNRIASDTFRFPVQDVYMRNKERILVGRVESGRIRKNQTVMYMPSASKAKVLQIKLFRQNKMTARQGESIGILLDGADSVNRGDVLCQENNRPAVTALIRASIFWLADTPFKKGEEAVFRCATQEARCHLDAIERKIDPLTLKVHEEDNQEVRKNEVAIVKLRMKKEVVVDRFDFIENLGRFILEKNKHVLGGGTILESKINE
jgi:sulfate adenylyltransferase subunit 1